MTILMVINAALAAGSAAFGIVAMLRPGLLIGGRTNDEPTHYYAQMYAARAIPFGLVTVAGCLVAAFSTDAEAVTFALLLAIGVSQVGDAAIGVRHRIVGMTVGASVAAVVHLATAIVMR